MRSLIVAVSVLVVALVAGCSSAPSPLSAAAARQAKPSQTQLVLVWLDKAADQEEQQAIHQKLVSTPGVHTVTFFTAEATYEKAKKEFANDPDLLKVLRPEAFTDNFQLVVDDRAAADRVTNAMKGVAGVRTVNAPSPSTLPAAPPTG